MLRARAVLAAGAQQKGAVEQLVGWVKRSFFACRRCHDRADLERQLAAWLTDISTVRPSRATGVILAVRLAEERARRRPLPIAPHAYALRFPVVVSAYTCPACRQTLLELDSPRPGR